ncbi:MAG: hypothetical protein EOP04_02275 [Proteobacteria bacterium]|nr:MAG: hypothetical protein EOP04_02275 [Pseudomonadota bacterium]
MRNTALALILLLSASFFSESVQAAGGVGMKPFPGSAFAGGSGGGVGMKPAKNLLELLEVSKGAAEISSEVYGIPNNYILDAKNRVVTFEENFEMTFDEIIENTEAFSEKMEIEFPAATDSAK